MLILQEHYILTFQGTNTNGVQGGLVKAHEISQIEREIRLDGRSPWDESCKLQT